MHSVGHQKGFVPSSIAETNDKPLLGRDSKQIVPPIYGCDISSLESTTDSTKLASTDLTMHGVKLHLTEGMKQSYDKCTIDSSCNLATFLLHYPAIVQLSVPPKEIIIECGPGFSGIAALHLGYQNVMFAATSADIVRNALWPNIILNCTGTCEVAHARCIASSNSVALSEYLSDPGPNK